MYEVLNEDLQFEKSFKKDTLYPKSFRELLTNEDFNSPIQMKPDKSPAEILLMIMEFVVKNKITLSGMSQMITIINNTFPEPLLPASRYMIDKLFNPKENIQYHAVCLQCGKYVGSFDCSSKSMNCSVCESLIDLTHLSSENFFIMIDPSEMIASYLSENSEYYEEVLHSKRTEFFEDIYDGKYYKEFRSKICLGDDEKYITVSFNTDGAPCFKSSRYSIWPIYIIINELPVQKRFECTITCGLWFGKSKPDMQIFLKQFVNMMNKLSSDGLKCNINGLITRIRVFCLVAPVDSVARAPMQGIMQFNGHYGCNWCFHPGNYLFKSMRYDVLGYYPELRNHKKMLQHIEESLKSNNPVYGVKYPSPLVNLSGFDIVDGLCPEYMHFWIGLIKQISMYLIRCLDKDQIGEMNYLILNFKVPNQLGRLSRSLDDVNDWKAKEWENWALYYSVPLLSLFIANKYVQHWAIMSDSLHTFLQASITMDEIEKTDKNLHGFVADVETLYSKEAMTYNCHQLLHAGRSVLNWGPLWAHSAYSFESANGNLLNAIKCARGVVQQIFRYLQLQKSLQVLKDSIYHNCSAVIKDFCNRIIRKEIMKCIKPRNIRYFGSEMMLENIILEQFQLYDKDFKVFMRIIKDNCIYGSCERANLRSCDSFARLDDGRFVEIHSFLVDEKNLEELTLCKVIQTRPNKFSRIIQEIEFISDRLSIIPTEKLSTICVFMKVKEVSYICKVPNLIHY